MSKGRRRGKVKREILFEAVRDEQGDLLLEVRGTAITMFMSVPFWNEVIERVQKPLVTEEHFPRGDLTRKDEVIDILKAGVRHQEQEEEETEKRA